MAVYKKDPNATLDYTVDWSAYLLPVADTIAAVTWLLTGGLAEVSKSNTTTLATIFLSGGTVDVEATATCRITTAGGRTDDRTLVFKIVEK